MDKKQFKRALSLLLCIIMLLGNIPTASAEGENPVVTEGGLCEHHQSHDGCGYIEGAAACGNVCDMCIASEEKTGCTGLADCTAENHAEDCQKKLVDDQAADAVAVLIEALPALADIQAKPMEKQGADYTQVQNAYAAYEQLTDAQKALLPPAEAVFKPYFDYFNSLTQEVAMAGSCGDPTLGKNNVEWTYSKDEKKLRILCGDITVSYAECVMADFSGNVPWEEHRNTIESIDINRNVSYIGAGAFASTYELSEVTFGGDSTYGCSAKTIGDRAFSGCSKLTRFPFGIDYLKVIGNYAFMNTGLTSANLPATLTTIGQEAFRGTALTSVTIPKKVTSIGGRAFYGCNQLTRITVDAENPNYSSDSSGVLFNKNKTSLIQAPAKYSGAYQVPSGVTSLEEGAFLNCTNLTNISIPDSVMAIGADAFVNCTKLTSIVIPKKANKIGTKAFGNCTNLSSIKFTGKAPTNIKSDIFSGVTATAYYPANDASWTETVRQQYGGQITWKAYCEDDAHVYDQEIVHEDYLKSEATCSDKAVYYKSCICGEKGTETFSGDSVGDHKYENGECIYCEQEETHLHGEEPLIPWNSTTELPSSAGSYYLTQDVIIAAAWSAPAGETTLCLNGHTISGYHTRTVGSGSTLNLLDCADVPGSVTYNVGSTRNCFAVEAGGVLNVSDISMVLNSAQNYMGEVFVSIAAIYNNGGIVNMTGGSISASANALCVPGVAVYCIRNNSGTVNISGGSLYAFAVSHGGDASYNAYCLRNDGTANVTGGTLTAELGEGNGPTNHYAYAIFRGYSDSSRTNLAGMPVINGCIGIPCADGICAKVGTTAYSGAPLTLTYTYGDALNNYDIMVRNVTEGVNDQKFTLVDKNGNAMDLTLVGSNLVYDTGETHEHNWTADDCESIRHCTVCEYSDGVVMGHIYNESTHACACGAIGGACGESVTWAFDPETEKLTISGEGPMADYAEQIYAPWWQYRSQIKTVEIEDGVTTVGAWAFHDFDNLTGIEIPSGVTSIGAGAFYKCEALPGINLPQTLKSIGQNAFFNTVSFTKVVIPNGVTTIGVDAFCCSNLRVVVIPASVQTIEGGAFSGCDRLWHVLYAGTEAQWNAIDFQPNVDNFIQNRTRHYTASAETVVANNGSDCEYYRPFKCTICNQICEERIYNSSHSWLEATCKAPKTCSVCSATRGVLNPDAHSYENGTCTLCGAVEDPCADGHDRDENHKCKDCGHIGGTCGENLTWEFDEQTGKLTISGEGAMYDYNDTDHLAPWMIYKTSLQYVEVKKNVTTIGQDAFADCDQLLQVELPDGLEKLGDRAFAYCWRLPSITLPDTVKNIGGAAFAQCTSLKEITLPAGVTEISNSLFYICSNLQRVEILGDITSVDKAAFACCEDLLQITLPNTVEVLGERAFWQCSSLTSITIPEKVMEIGNLTFEKCEALQTVILPQGLKVIGQEAFANCKNLKNIQLPNQLTTIGQSAFAYSGLQSLAIPESVTAVRTMAFCDCTDLQTVQFLGRAPAIGADAFQYTNITAKYPRTASGWDENTMQQYGGTVAWQMYCKDDVHAYDQEKAEAKYLVSEATCTAKAIYKKSCVCGEPGTETFAHGEVKKHVYDQSKAEAKYLVSEATCTAKAVYKKSCVCGEPGTETFAHGEVKKHVYDQSKAEAKYQVSEATCTAKAVYKKSCVCGEPGTEIFAHGEVKKHVYDQEKAEVKYLVSEATCTTKAVYKKSCVCGEPGTETFAHGEVKKHVYDQSKAEAKYLVSEATCTAKAVYKKSCVCGEPGTETFAHGEVKKHVYDQEKAEAKYLVSEATCTAKAKYYKSCKCGAAGTEAFEYGNVKAHIYKDTVTQPTCTERGYTTHTCACGHSYVDTYVAALGHDMGEWTVVNEPTLSVAGLERSDCTRCDYYDTRGISPKGNVLKLEGEDFVGQSTVWINGMPYPVVEQGTDRYVELPTEEECMLVTYTYHVGDASDVHTQYPTGMKVYKVSGGVMTHIPELDNLLQYSGCSIRITGNKGIRMITSLTQANKAALTGDGLAGYKLVEYGTMICWASDIATGDALTLGKSFTRSNFAYKRGVADPVFATSGNLTQYTNVLVGFSNEQCKDDIAMRSYIILEDASGQQVTLYGGTIYRSIGYIAYQNRNVFQPSTAAYNYVWDIIHSVYGSEYDTDYRG